MKILTSALVCLAILSAQQSNCQDLVFKKKIIHGIDEVNVGVGFEGRNSLAKKFMGKPETTFSRERPVIDRLVHDSNGAKILIRHSHKKAEMVKVVNNQVVATAPYDTLQEIVTPIDDEGNLIAEFIDDGDGYGITFLTPELKEMASYAPYPEGFGESKLGYSDKFVCFYAVSESKPKNYKLGLLDHHGKLIAEREFERGDYGTSNIKIVGNWICLLQNDYGSPASKISCFDGALNFLWERKSQDRLSGYSFESDEASKTILLITQRKISCIGVDDGKNKWELLPDEVYGKSVPKSYSRSYIIDGRYIAITISELVSDKLNNSKFINSTLFVLDSENGVKQYEEELGSFDSAPKVIGGKEGFIISIDNQILSYNARTSKK